MKSFNRVIAFTVIVMIFTLLAADFLLIRQNNRGNTKEYLVEVSRISNQISKNGYESVNISDCRFIKHVEKHHNDDFYNTESDYLIRKINGELYRFDYEKVSGDNISSVIIVNSVLAVVFTGILFLLFYIRSKIILPFERLKDVPYELSKGNLTIPMKADKSKYFGKFIWGIDMLRESMEQQKKRELELHKDRKTLLLSLSHDIKTPLSAIMLYAKALSKGLYSDKEKQLEISDNINAKAKQIEEFVSQIIDASKDDFLSLEVNMSEFYLSDLVNKIHDYYAEKLSLIKTELIINKYSNCLIKGDIDRSAEVLQNIIENAVKYGDGKEIIIDFGEEDDCILISIKNSGCTLPDIELPHIFDSFWRGSNSSNKSGSGLGLHICRQLMNKMNGDIFAKIQSEYIIVTTVFTKA